MPYVRVNGIDIFYELQGHGPVLALHHGFAGPSGGWPPVVDELRDRFTILTWDARAHGKTGMPDDPATVTVPQMAADMAGLFDALGIERPWAGGVSMGGMVTAQFACDFPGRARAIMLFDTTAGNGGDPETAPMEREVVEIFERLERVVRKHGLDELVRRENRYRHEEDPYAKLAFFTLEEQDERNRANKVDRMTPEGFIAANIALRTRPDLTSRTPKIAEPVLVSCGEWDRFYPGAVRDHRLIPGSRFATIRGAAHDTLTYTPHLWKRALLDFVDDLEAGCPIAGEREYA